MTIALTILEVIASIILIVVVLMQTGKEGLSGAVAGNTVSRQTPQRSSIPGRTGIGGKYSTTASRAPTAAPRARRLRLR